MTNPYYCISPDDKSYICHPSAFSKFSYLVIMSHRKTSLGQAFLFSLNTWVPPSLDSLVLPSSLLVPINTSNITL